MAEIQRIQAAGSSVNPIINTPLTTQFNRSGQWSIAMSEISLEFCKPQIFWLQTLSGLLGDFVKVAPAHEFANLAQS